MSVTHEDQDPDKPPTNLAPTHMVSTDAVPSTPGWVKVMGSAAVLLVLLFLILHLTGLAPIGH